MCQEKTKFAKRLRLALEKKGISAVGIIQLTKQFNARYAGCGISSRTMYRWLAGNAIPCADKLSTLATWLGVNAHWLREGTARIEEYGERTCQISIPSRNNFKE